MGINIRRRRERVRKWTKKKECLKSGRRNQVKWGWKWFHMDEV